MLIFVRRIFFSIVNSLYSLYWDVVVDWHLFQKTSRGNSSSSRFLRPNLHFSHTIVYYAAILIDAVLRLSWTIKVTLLYRLVRATLYNDLMPSSIGIDVGLKVLELVRRWVWVFFRVEREWVAKGSLGLDDEGLLGKAKD